MICGCWNPSSRRDSWSAPSRSRWVNRPKSMLVNWYYMFIRVYVNTYIYEQYIYTYVAQRLCTSSAWTRIDIVSIQRRSLDFISEGDHFRGSASWGSPSDAGEFSKGKCKKRMILANFTQYFTNPALILLRLDEKHKLLRNFDENAIEKLTF